MGVLDFAKLPIIRITRRLTHGGFSELFKLRLGAFESCASTTL
jgi:hypothetical protein